MPKHHRRSARRRHDYNDPASPSPVSDGKAVYAFFSVYGLTAYGLDGAEIWTTELGRFEALHRMAASPVGAGNKVVLFRTAERHTPSRISLRRLSFPRVGADCDSRRDLYHGRSGRQRSGLHDSCRQLNQDFLFGRSGRDRVADARPRCNGFRTTATFGTPFAAAPAFESA